MISFQIRAEESDFCLDHRSGTVSALLFVHPFHNAHDSQSVCGVIFIFSLTFPDLIFLVWAFEVEIRMTKWNKVELEHNQRSASIVQGGGLFQTINHIW